MPTPIQLPTVLFEGKAREAEDSAAIPSSTLVCCTSLIPPPPTAETVSVKDCVAAVPTPLLAVIVIGYVPAVPAAGVPASVAVPLPLSLKVTGLGNDPDSLRAGVGEPVVVTVKLPAAFTAKLVLFALVIVGAP